MMISRSPLFKRIFQAVAYFLFFFPFMFLGIILLIYLWFWGEFAMNISSVFVE